MHPIGILFALGALLSWGIGDFLIQRSARKFGDWIALFYITAASSVALFPFVYRDLPDLFRSERAYDLGILLLASFVILFAAILDFEALRIGKISVVEPIFALEVVVTASLSVFLIKEGLTPLQTTLIAALLIGLFLVATRSFGHLKSIHLEKGVIQAIFATVGMGLFNFLVGIGARQTSPFMINWFTDLFITLVALGYFVWANKFGEMIADWKKNKKLILSVCFFDNAAWLSYAFSTLYIPIAIATAVSESYIALAAGLGLIVNREKLKPHQFAGMVTAVACVIALAAITK